MCFVDYRCDEGNKNNIYSILFFHSYLHIFFSLLFYDVRSIHLLTNFPLQSSNLLLIFGRIEFFL